MIARRDGLIRRPNRDGNAHRAARSRGPPWNAQARGSAAVNVIADHWARTAEAVGARRAPAVFKLAGEAVFCAFPTIRAPT
jgi:hypothetical protein